MSAPILESAKVAATVTRLRERIGDRFPESGLHGVCGRLEEIANKTQQTAEWISRPIWWVRLINWIVVGLSVCVSLMIIPLFRHHGMEDLTLRGVLELGDPIMNELVLLGAAFFFFFTLETRIKRNRALKAIHELRSIAHVIDMHQLTKDPERVINPNYQRTEVSPKETMTRFQLRRYLDYCSEMLSLSGKLAALYVQDFDDEVALQSVNEVESLGTGLSRKIWQKIMILHSGEEDADGNEASARVEPAKQPSLEGGERDSSVEQ